MPPFQTPPFSPTLMVRAPARLHLGFIDVTGSAGRQFGSLGISLNEIETTVAAQWASHDQAYGPGYQRALNCLKRITPHLAREQGKGIAITIQKAIPEHIGLGSGTQLDLAVATACNALAGYPLDAGQITGMIERGARSGIGLACFEHGGLIVDGGKGDRHLRPPIVSRLVFPEEWRFILVFDKRGQGLHGLAEKQAFSSLPPFMPEEAHRLAHLILMQALPAVAEADIRLFGESVTELQRTVGDYFAPAQGGRFTSPVVADAMMWLQARGATGIGQSSWGPTGFCLAESFEQAYALVSGLRQKTHESSPHLQLMIASPRNRGADIHFS